MHYTALIAPPELATILDSPDLVVIDCRCDLARPDAGPAGYREAHIPGARYAHLEQDLSGPVTPASGRHPLPDPTRLARRFGAWGIDASTQVVAYDDQAGTMAARLWWLLRWMGHPKTAVLDGGLRHWRAGGLPLDTGTPRPRTGSFSGEPDPRMLIETREVVAGLDGGDVLIDVRTAERYRGEKEPIDPVAGHVPGAVNIPLQENLDGEGRFLTAAQLRSIYAESFAARDARRVAVMCGSGVTACHTLLAMRVAGLDGARLYHGSWSEWIRDPGRPVATGEHPN